MPPFETIALRIGAIVAGLALWFLTQRLIGARSLGDTQHYDHLHVLTAGWNRWLHEHPRAANAVLIASSLGVDVVTLFVLARAVFGPTFTPFWGLLVLFMMRQISQALVALPPPPGIIWRDPGVPSLFVTYGVGNDFFFSGHTARQRGQQRWRIHWAGSNSGARACAGNPVPAVPCAAASRRRSGPLRRSYSLRRSGSLSTAYASLTSAACSWSPPRSGCSRSVPISAR